MLFPLQAGFPGRGGTASPTHPGVTALAVPGSLSLSCPGPGAGLGPLSPPEVSAQHVASHARVSMARSCFLLVNNVQWPFLWINMVSYLFCCVHWGEQGHLLLLSD